MRKLTDQSFTSAYFTANTTTAESEQTPHVSFQLAFTRLAVFENQCK